MEWRNSTYAMDLSKNIADLKGFTKLQGHDVCMGRSYHEILHYMGLESGCYSGLGQRMISLPALWLCMLGFHSLNSLSSSKEPASAWSASLQLGFLESELNSHSESEAVLNWNSNKPASALTWQPY